MELGLPSPPTTFIPTITMTTVTDGDDRKLDGGVEIVAPADVRPFPLPSFFVILLLMSDVRYSHSSEVG
jgi:hypothetical protein